MTQKKGVKYLKETNEFVNIVEKKLLQKMLH